MRILLVEDEQLLLDQLRRQFEQAGYACDCASDGSEGLFLGQENPYDLAVVDLGLPKLDGISVIKQWRSKGRKFPVLILTARDRWQDKVEGLESGADDYVAKPFQIEEVMARANALIRRSAGFASPKMEFGCITIDTGAKRALLNNQALELTAYEYNALEYMAMRSGQVVSKTDLTEHLYDQDFDRDSNVIEVFIARLRKKIDPDNTLKPISTLRGRGYRFELGETQH
ncbi:response regulator [gamma proteobacterium BDW918]|jgi:two-component system, OmpR family, response regulator PhoP|uniref:Two-component system response regulator n=1 Tax=Zhongshania aliphaticivorans TaxID=1470434 RepID=A0A127M6G8_9GAMM|nr:response regulator transcription factor [Zhongshania aliphaticivorans]AMO68791.1 two-component system response regulator [Zhongshania aliphaticivorans]EIF43273.1 response regulator [gamma proteobacterium BDW918]|tara:strand:- start:27817 stop:28500 length:684 start_codon:yes stop_codon:yes gene_type:complete